MACSFQVLEDGLSHARTMPDVPKPDDLPDERELIEARLDSLPEAMREMMQRERPIELKRVEPIDYANPKKMSPKQHTWFRAKHPLGDDMASSVHACLCFRHGYFINLHTASWEVVHDRSYDGEPRPRHVVSPTL